MDVSAPNLFVNGAQGPIVAGGYRFWVLMHESLHAIGLEHPSPGGVGSQVLAPHLEGVEATHAYTAMSYEQQPTIANRPEGPQIYDIAALQTLYGARAANTGDNVYEGWT